MPRISTGVEGGAVSSNVSAIVKHGSNLAVDVAYNEIVAGVERAVLHEDGGHRAAAAIEFGFEHDARCSAFWSGLQLREIGDQADHFEQKIQIGFLFRRDVDENRFAAPVFRHQAAIGELFLHAIGHGVGLVDLVDCDNDGNFRGMRVIDGFDRLRHHAIIGSHDQHDDVSGLGAARTHASEGFVTGRIEKHNLAAERRRLTSSVMRTL